jgi:hypothetical protein
VRWYQLQHPAEVVGLVLVDSMHEDQLLLGVNGKPMPIWAMTLDQVRAMIPPDRLPSQPVPAAQTGAPFDKLPPEILRLHINVLDLPHERSPDADPRRRPATPCWRRWKDR